MAYRWRRQGTQESSRSPPGTAFHGNFFLVKLNKGRTPRSAISRSKTLTPTTPAATSSTCWDTIVTFENLRIVELHYRVSLAKSQIVGIDPWSSPHPQVCESSTAVTRVSQQLGMMPRLLSVIARDELMTRSFPGLCPHNLSAQTPKHEAW